MDSNRLFYIRGSFACVLLLVLIVGFYTQLFVKTLDDWNNTYELTEMTRDQSTMQQNNTLDKFHDRSADNLGPDCENFDHGDQTPASNVTSIFNCGSKESSCRYFYPAKFFDPKCGLGREYAEQVAYMNNLFEAKELWLSGPPIVLPWVSIDPDRMKVSAVRNGLPWQRHNLSFTHVHKTGGTSLVAAFSDTLRLGAKGKRRTMYLPGKIYADKNKWSIKGIGYNESSVFLDGATKYKKNWGENDHTLFGVVRDPVERFISAIGQATGAFGSSSNGVGKALLDACVNSNYTTERDCLRCFIDLIKTNSTWIEVHFTPMALEIAFATMYKDIPVAIFDFPEVPKLLFELGTDPNSKKKDGHQPGYRKKALLTNMKVEHYDEEMLKDLCGIYRVDAIFLKQIGVSTPCQKFI